MLVVQRVLEISTLPRISTSEGSSLVLLRKIMRCCVVARNEGVPGHSLHSAISGCMPPDDIVVYTRRYDTLQRFQKVS